MFFTFADQTVTFFISLLMGVVLCLLYDVFRIIRLAFRPSKWMAFLQDLIYWSICELFTFGVLMVRCNGEIRGYVFAGELLGWIICRCTLSVAIMKISGVIIGTVRRVKNFIKLKIVRPIVKRIRKTYRFIQRKMGSLTKNVHKFIHNLKKNLKHNKRLVYNDGKTTTDHENVKT